MLTKTFGARLKKFRTQRGLTQRELSAASGVTHVTIARYERGRGLPTLFSVELLLNALKIPFGEFFKEES